MNMSERVHYVPRGVIPNRRVEEYRRGTRIMLVVMNGRRCY